MKLREDFVTNSSSSSFILHLNKFKKEIREKAMKIILNPLAYKEDFIKWLMETRPLMEKVNPKGIPHFYFENDKLIENEEYNLLPDKIKDEHEDLWIEDYDTWSIVKVDDTTFDFCTSMDDFDYLLFCQFALEKAGNFSFKNNPNAKKLPSRVSSSFMKFVDYFPESGIWYDLSNKRWSLPEVEFLG